MLGTVSHESLFREFRELARKTGKYEHGHGIGHSPLQIETSKKEDSMLGAPNKRVKTLAQSPTFNTFAFMPIGIGCIDNFSLLLTN